MAILLSIHPDNPQENRLKQVVDCIKKGGVIIYPTDTVYGIGCNLYDEKAIAKICRIKDVKPNKMHLSFICYDLSDISKYARTITTPTFRLMKKALPGAFTFILDSTKEVPKLFDMKKKQVGIRVPDHKIPREIVRMLGNPIITTSIKDADAEHMTDPELIFEMYQKQVDMVIDGGIGGLIPSTVIDCTDDSFEILRQGAGNLEEAMS